MTTTPLNGTTCESLKIFNAETSDFLTIYQECIGNASTEKQVEPRIHSFLSKSTMYQVTIDVEKFGRTTNDGSIYINIGTNSKLLGILEAKHKSDLPLSPYQSACALCQAIGYKYLKEQDLEESYAFYIVASEKTFSLILSQDIAEYENKILSRCRELGDITPSKLYKDSKIKSINNDYKNRLNKMAQKDFESIDAMYIYIVNNIKTT